VNPTWGHDSRGTSKSKLFLCPQKELIKQLAFCMKIINRYNYTYTLQQYCPNMYVVAETKVLTHQYLLCHKNEQCNMPSFLEYIQKYEGSSHREGGLNMGLIFKL
jgi:hypothetical protein